MDIIYQEVDFTYCESCKHHDSTEVDIPCVHCLENPKNLYSSKPVDYEEDT